MECNDAVGQSMQSHQWAASPVRVSSGAWFYVRCAVKKGSDEHDAFIAHTYSSVRTLVARANGADTVLYLGSPQEDGEMVLRRVVAVRQVRNTNMHIFEFEDAQAVLWDEKKDVEAASVYVDIDAPVCIG